ncbi:hypothetical protein B0H14DRAFT_3476079 [Mycena olivaceomarginata]|nr:hypothetical protein B0H14DRAFT_3476079 [Mycena olivaceomarginata]
MLGRVEQQHAIVVTLANKKDIAGHKLARVPVPLAGRARAAPLMSSRRMTPSRRSRVPRTAVGVATTAAEHIRTHSTPLVVPVAPPKLPPPLPDDGALYGHAMHAHAPVLVLVMPPCPLCEPHRPRPQEGVTWGLDGADVQDRVRGEAPQACREAAGRLGRGRMQRTKGRSCSAGANLGCAKEEEDGMEPHCALSFPPLALPSHYFLPLSFHTSIPDGSQRTPDTFTFQLAVSMHKWS